MSPSQKQVLWAEGWDILNWGMEWGLAIGEPLELQVNGVGSQKGNQNAGPLDAKQAKRQLVHSRSWQCCVPACSLVPGTV